MILGIETASTMLSVALSDNGAILSSITFNKKNSHDEMLIHLVQQLMANGKWDMRALRGVAVSSGPGSFTGLRIGMAVAKGIAFSLNIPIINVRTFDAMAWRIARRGMLVPGECLATIFDAKRQDVYLAVYEITEDTYRRISHEISLSVEEADAMLPENCWLVGNGASKLFSSHAYKYRIISETEAVCHAEAVALLGEKMLERGETAHLESCEPLYARDFHATTPKSFFS